MKNNIEFYYDGNCYYLWKNRIQFGVLYAKNNEFIQLPNAWGQHIVESFLLHPIVKKHKFYDVIKSIVWNEEGRTLLDLASEDSEIIKQGELFDGLPESASYTDDDWDDKSDEEQEGAYAIFENFGHAGLNAEATFGSDSIKAMAMCYKLFGYGESVLISYQGSNGNQARSYAETELQLLWGL